MTSDEIKALPHGLGFQMAQDATNFWLKELCCQLAVMNEQRSKQMDRILEQGDTIQNSFQSLGSRVGAGSETEVRGRRYNHRLRVTLANALAPILTQASKDAGFSEWLADAIEQQFVLVERTRCSDCGESLGHQHKPSCHRLGSVTPASDYRDRRADERTTRPDPQTAPIQDKESLRCLIEDAMRRADRIRPRVPDDSSEI